MIVLWLAAGVIANSGTTPPEASAFTPAAGKSHIERRAESEKVQQKELRKFQDSALANLREKFGLTPKESSIADVALSMSGEAWAKAQAAILAAKTLKEAQEQAIAAEQLRLELVAQIELKRQAFIAEQNEIFMLL